MCIVFRDKNNVWGKDTVRARNLDNRHIDESPKSTHFPSRDPYRGFRNFPKHSPKQIPKQILHRYIPIQSPFPPQLKNSSYICSWLADKVISPYITNNIRTIIRITAEVVNSWQSHIPPISQTTKIAPNTTRKQLWIADKVISPLYHKQPTSSIPSRATCCE